MRSNSVNTPESKLKNVGRQEEPKLELAQSVSIFYFAVRVAEFNAVFLHHISFILIYLLCNVVIAAKLLTQ